MTLTSAPADAPASTRSIVITQAALCLLAAVLFTFRSVRTGLGDALPDEAAATAGVLLAALAAVLCAVAAGLAFRRSPRRAGAPVVVALLLDLLVLDRYAAPPRLVTAIPLVFALALAVVRPSPWPTTTQPRSRFRTVAGVVALVLMAPVGLYYFLTGLVAPSPDVFGAYALFGVLATIAVLLARRRSWWVLAMPPVSAGLWFLMLWLGETFLDWSA